MPPSTKATPKAAARTARKSTAKRAVAPSAKSRPSPAPEARARRAKAGDIPPRLNAAGVEKFVVDESVSTAQEAKVVAMKDILAHAGGASHELIESLEAIMRGASPEDAEVLRNALLRPAAPAIVKQLSPDEELAEGWRDGGYPYKNLMSRKNYEKQKHKLQVELLKLQAWVKETGQKVVILLEGRDAAGKGGTIKRMMEHLKPRGARVVALEKPTETKRGQWYFQRYVQNLPTAGEIALFDRYWYNRAGVERVMGFCTDDEYLEFMRQAPEFERNLVRSGIHLIKFWFYVSREEQRHRFKKRARLNALRYVLHKLPYTNKDADRIGLLDPLLVGRAHVVYERGEHMGGALI